VQPEVAFGKARGGVLAQAAKHGRPAARRAGAFEQREMAAAAHAVADQSRHGHVRIEGGKAMRQGRHGARHARRIADERDGRAQPTRNLRARTRQARRACSVEQAHHALDQRDVRRVP
jgi:hypothetical protein